MVRRMNQDPHPLLQLDMPSRPPQDPLPPGTGPDSEFVKVGFSRPAILVYLGRNIRSPKHDRHSMIAPISRAVCACTGMQA